MKPGINEFFDINKLPTAPGITYYALSMPLLTTVQRPEECYEADLRLIEKLLVSNCGAQVVYTDNLYLYSDERAVDLKLKHQKLIEEHKRGWLNLISKNIYIIPSAFTFMTWGQLLLDTPFFHERLLKFKELYNDNTIMQKYVILDIEGTGRIVNENTVGYLLEEILLDYCVVKGISRLQNEYTHDKEEWVLNCYHGKPHRAYVYLLQQNFFKEENPKNPYQNAWYDLSAKKLYEFERLDIETFDFSKNN